jgi:hypothetical protein
MHPHTMAALGCDSTTTSTAGAYLIAACASVSNHLRMGIPEAPPSWRGPPGLGELLACASVATVIRSRRLHAGKALCGSVTRMTFSRSRVRVAWNIFAGVSADTVTLWKEPMLARLDRCGPASLFGALHRPGACCVHVSVARKIPRHERESNVVPQNTGIHFTFINLPSSASSPIFRIAFCPLDGPTRWCVCFVSPLDRRLPRCPICRPVQLWARSSCLPRSCPTSEAHQPPA